MTSRDSWPLVPLVELMTPVSRRESVDPERTYQALLAYRRFPEGLFVGSDQYIQGLIAKLSAKKE